MASVQGFIAVTRFGLGAAPGELEAVSADPRGWLTAQLSPRYASPAALNNLPTTRQAAASLKETLGPARRMKKEGAMAETADNLLKAAKRELRDEYLDEVDARTQAAVTSSAPFLERLVHFWSNHFTVSVQKPQVLPLAGAFERDAIRPHILGRFEDLLIASSRHPAMLTYLDNARSIGPGSRLGRRRGKGLNENLAREILELHTLGVNGGYQQDDVISLARMLTGWTVDAVQKGNGSGFLYVPFMHEPGEKNFLGRRYGGGETEATQALRDLAARPATARFVSTKLARHFISDEPPAEAVERLAAAYMNSGGDLASVYRTLVSLDNCWRDPLAKVKTPNDYLLSMLRSTGIGLGRLHTAGAYKFLNQMPFSAPSPAGWSDEARDWIGAEALLQRVDLGRKLARAIPAGAPAKQLLEQTIGPVASPETKTAVAAAGSPAEAYTLLFASPEFQRR